MKKEKVVGIYCYYDDIYSSPDWNIPNEFQEKAKILRNAYYELLKSKLYKYLPDGLNHNIIYEIYLKYGKIPKKEVFLKILKNLN
ncbi:MAG: hypothetical protein QW474_01585 [Candidatus Aenigmatarchaeota archaeon]